MSEHEPHVLPVTAYLAVFGALMVLTLLTVGVAFQNIGMLNNIVMLAIAIAKAGLVVAIFMHLRWNPKILWVVASSGFIWLVVMLALTLSDLMSRGWMPNPPQTWL